MSGPHGEMEQQPPVGWIIRGDAPHDYDVGLDTSTAHQGQASGYLKNRLVEPSGFVTLMQMFQSLDYCGQRVKLSAYVKSVDVTGWAGLWMRVDGQRKTLSFDNMEERPIKGTTDWTQYAVVLDVPEESAYIAFGIILSGQGQVWIDDVALAVVSKDTPSTAMELEDEEEQERPQRDYPTQPQNLDFEAYPKEPQV